MVTVHDSYTLILEVPYTAFADFLCELITQDINHYVIGWIDKKDYIFEITYKRGEPDNSQELQKILRELIEKK